MTARDNMLRTLEQEAQDLLRELQRIPTFKRFEAIRQVIELYGGSITLEAAPQKGARVPEEGAAMRSPTSVIAEEAEKFFREVGRRYTSGPLAKALIDRGVHIPGKVPSARLASVLASRRKVFNNIEGQGYGLTEWGDSANSDKHDSSEAPAPARADASKSNGTLPLDR